MIFWNSYCVANNHNVQNYSNNVQAFAQVTKTLAKHGVQLRYRDQRLVLLIPLEKIFATKSANFTKGSKNILIAIARMARLKPDTLLSSSVHICGKQGILGRNLALECSRKVANYLWEMNEHYGFIYVSSEMTHSKCKHNILVIEFVDFY